MTGPVLDASAVVEILLGTDAGLRSEPLIEDTVPSAPAHLDAEVLSALGRMHRAGEIESGRVADALVDLRAMPLTRASLEPLLVDAWRLRHNLSLRDALYVALAQALDVTLVTGDARLAGAPALPVSLHTV